MRRKHYVVLGLILTGSMALVTGNALGQGTPAEPPAGPPINRLARIPGAPSFSCPPALAKTTGCTPGERVVPPRATEDHVVHVETRDPVTGEMRSVDVPYTAAVEAEQDEFGGVKAREVVPVDDIAQKVREALARK